jgi:type II secretory pathway predicted ATPase ExeA/predicted transcriptional regulator
MDVKEREVIDDEINKEETFITEKPEQKSDIEEQEKQTEYKEKENMESKISDEEFKKSSEIEDKSTENDKTISHEVHDVGEFRKRLREWYKKFNWKENPFAFEIIPETFVGYEKQKTDLMAAIEQKEKAILLLGPTGSGKTTMSRWLENELKKNGEAEILFISKAPIDTNELITQLNSLFTLPWYLSFLSVLNPNIKNTSEIVEKLSKKFNKKRLVLIVDEAHESSVECLQWFRVIIDHVNATLVLSALPIFETFLEQKLETLRKRVTTRVVLSMLTKDEVRELIEKRIEHASNGMGKNPFTNEAINKIYEISSGFPREVLRLCNDAVNKAILEFAEYVDAQHVVGEPVKKTEFEVKEQIFEITRFPKRQREVIDALLNGATTPSEILEKISLDKYKSREHALRSVNNILQRLLKQGIVLRKKQGKTYVYILSPKMKTLLTKA